MFDIFCIYLPFFYPLGVPLYAFGVKKRSSWNLLASLAAYNGFFRLSVKKHSDRA